MQNIYLSGFMGSGKSTVGQLLARKLGRHFVDTDSLIEARLKTTIKKFFKAKGETAFRKVESQIITELGQKQNLVVGLGGGAILSPHNRAVLRQGEWVFLHVPLAVIKRRLKNDKSRPLLTKSAPPLESLYAQRMPLYTLAKHVIYCDNYAPDHVCSLILATL